MEIERKFLIKEKNKAYPSLFEIKKLEKEIIKNGSHIKQYYISPKLIPKDLATKIKFKPNEFRIREIDKKYFLTIKSKGKLEREEFEIKIEKNVFDKYKKLNEKSLHKIRLIKNYNNKVLEFDYYENYDLITMEIEFKSTKEAKEFKVPCKEITKNKKYRSRKLAK